MDSVWGGDVIWDDIFNRVIDRNGGGKMKAELKNDCFYRDNIKQFCPHCGVGVECNRWCPAFNYRPKTDNITGRVELRCFPQTVEFEVKE